MVLYPKEGVSEIQRAQMVSADDPNTRVIGVNGDFDFCQTSIKTIFNDLSFNKKLMDTFSVQLSAANSLNWGRLLPQVVYHASAYLDLVKSGAISIGEMADLCVPTGNFGNILAAYYVKVRYCTELWDACIKILAKSDWEFYGIANSWQPNWNLRSIPEAGSQGQYVKNLINSRLFFPQEMGIPFNNLVCASNENNVLTEFFHTGSYNMATRRLQQTISPSIDILKSSNLERLFYHASGSGTVVANLMRSLEENKVFKVSAGLVWENGRHFATPPLVSLRNDVWRASHIWVVLLWLVVPRGKFASTNQKHSSYLDSDASGISALNPQTLFAGEPVVALRSVGRFLRLVKASSPLAITLLVQLVSRFPLSARCSYISRKTCVISCYTLAVVYWPRSPWFANGWPKPILSNRDGDNSKEFL